jgi:hypothetical protein
MLIPTQPFRTSADLVQRVLSNLGVVTAGQPVEVEDSDTVSQQLDSIFRKLAALELVYIADANNIPGEWFSDVADIVTGEVATSFGASTEDYVKLVTRGLGGAGGVPVLAGTAAQSLKLMLRGRPTYEPLRTESF